MPCKSGPMNMLVTPTIYSRLRPKHCRSVTLIKHRRKILVRLHFCSMLATNTSNNVPNKEHQRLFQGSLKKGVSSPCIHLLPTSIHVRKRLLSKIDQESNIKKNRTTATIQEKDKPTSVVHVHAKSCQRCRGHQHLQTIGVHHRYRHIAKPCIFTDFILIGRNVSIERESRSSSH